MAGRDLTYFISDLHLGAGYIADQRAHEMKVVEWLREIAPRCRRLFLLGDVIDYWYEYRYVVPKGFVRFFGQLAAMADDGIEITWFTGNHDIWIFDYLPQELGIRVIDGSLTTQIDGACFYMAHGDAIGSLKPGFRFMRWLFRNKVAQCLFSAVHPGLTIPFAHRWSSSSRKGATGKYDSYLGDDREPMVPWATQYASEHPEVNYILLGHRHILLDREVGEHCRLIVLGDWIRHFSYAVWDGKALQLKELAERS